MFYPLFAQPLQLILNARLHSVCAGSATNYWEIMRTPCQTSGGYLNWSQGLVREQVNMPLLSTLK